MISDYMQTQFKVPLENLSIISGPSHAEEIAQEIDAEHKERQSPFRFSMCNIQPGEEIEYCNNPEIKCTVVDDKTVSYQGQSYSLSSLAQLLTGSKYSVAGPRYFKYKGASLTLLGSLFSCRASCKRARTAAFYARTRFYLNSGLVQISSGRNGLECPQSLAAPGFPAFDEAARNDLLQPRICQ